MYERIKLNDSPPLSPDAVNGITSPAASNLHLEPRPKVFLGP